MVLRDHFGKSLVSVFHGGFLVATILFSLEGLTYTLFGSVARLPVAVASTSFGIGLRSLFVLPSDFFVAYETVYKLLCKARLRNQLV